MVILGGLCCGREEGRHRGVDLRWRDRGRNFRGAEEDHRHLEAALVRSGQRALPGRLCADIERGAPEGPEGGPLGPPES